MLLVTFRRSFHWEQSRFFMVRERGRRPGSELFIPEVTKLISKNHYLKLRYGEG